MKWILLGVTVSSLLAADSGAGEQVFAKRCSGCHALDGDKEGPRLRGVLGRRAGTVSGFPYSEPLRKSGMVWSDATLDRWLEDSQSVVPGNDMEFRVRNSDERGAIIAYLKSLPAK